MASPWYTCWGTYLATGPYNNVAMYGGPDSSGLGYNMNEPRLHPAGRGLGIMFEDLGHKEGTIYRRIAITMKLIPSGVTSGMSGLRGQNYVGAGVTYSWFQDIHYTSAFLNGSYNHIGTFNVANHLGGWPLYDVAGWESNCIDIRRVVEVPEDFTVIRTEIRGETPAQRHQNFYTREQVIPVKKDFKPWAIRKSNVFKTLNRDSGFFKIRNAGNWLDKSTMLEDYIGNNQGSSRIRKSGSWKGQNKIGS